MYAVRKSQLYKLQPLKSKKEKAPPMMKESLPALMHSTSVHSYLFFALISLGIQKRLHTFSMLDEIGVFLFHFVNPRIPARLSFVLKE
jgi:hypothetical protein